MFIRQGQTPFRKQNGDLSTLGVCLWTDVPRWSRTPPRRYPEAGQKVTEKQRHDATRFPIMHGCDSLIYIFHHASVLIRVLPPGESVPSALRLPSTESGVPVRAWGVELRGAGPSLVTSA